MNYNISSMACLLDDLDKGWQVNMGLISFSYTIIIERMIKHATTTMPYFCRILVASWLGSMASFT